MKKLISFAVSLFVVFLLAPSAQALHFDQARINMGIKSFETDGRKVELLGEKASPIKFKATESIIIRLAINETGDATDVKLSWELSGLSPDVNFREYHPEGQNWTFEDSRNFEYRRAGWYRLQLVLWLKVGTGDYIEADEYAVDFEVLPDYHALYIKSFTGAGLIHGGMPPSASNFERISRFTENDFLRTAVNLKYIIGCETFRLKVELENKKGEIFPSFSDSLRVIGPCSIYWTEAQILVEHGFMAKGTYMRRIFISFDEKEFVRVDGDKNKTIVIAKAPPNK